jgi:hypothetical protein
MADFIKRAKYNPFYFGVAIPLIAMVPGAKAAWLKRAEFLFLRISHLFFPTTGRRSPESG